MLLFPLHVIDVPSHCCHGDDGILYHLIPRITFIKVFGQLLPQEGDTKSPNVQSGRNVLLSALIAGNKS